MKTKLFLTILLVLGLSYYHWAQTASAPPEKSFPYIEVVVTQERIWLMADEKPVQDLPVQVTDANGVVVLQQVFDSKTTEWALDVSALPAGKYKILIGSIQTEYLEKQGGKRRFL